MKNATGPSAFFPWTNGRDHRTSGSPTLWPRPLITGNQESCKQMSAFVFNPTMQAAVEGGTLKCLFYSEAVAVSALASGGPLITVAGASATGTSPRIGSSLR